MAERLFDPQASHLLVVSIDRVVQSVTTIWRYIASGVKQRHIGS